MAIEQWVVVDPAGNFIQATNTKSESYSKYCFVRKYMPASRFPVIPDTALNELAQEIFKNYESEGFRCIRVEMKEIE